MAYTRMSAHEIDRVCKRFLLQFERYLKDKINKRKYKLMNRPMLLDIFSLLEEDALKKIDKEMPSLIQENIMEFGDDWAIYNELMEVSRIARAQDFITIDSFEAKFINKYRGGKNE